MRGWLREHRRATVGFAGVAIALAAFGVLWFGPQYLFIDHTVSEALPSVAEPEGSSTGPGSESSPDPPAAEATVVARGELRSLEHESSGTALIIELPDGSRFLRLEDLETSNGPDLRVIVSDQAVSDEWRIWDDGSYFDLGPLKGNIGSSNYAIPSDVELSRFRTAVVWCRRFSVGFAVAPLDAA
ncbi:MAG TPA: DM13 domain-containing protein [Actinomycetota bacterium]|jgi:hypothetical protein